MPESVIQIADLMAQSNVKFGTSGARGQAGDMTDRVCYAYTKGFLQYLMSENMLSPGTVIGVGGDLRPSTDRIMNAVCRAIQDMGNTPENCGKLPSPALACYGIHHNIPTVMVTGSHIPDDRNGIKFTKPEGEILKEDEQKIKKQTISLPDIFNDRGALKSAGKTFPVIYQAVEHYIRRYLDFFPSDYLDGLRIGVYQHSAVGRDILVDILSGLGAQVTPLGFSDTFIPVDTEAIRPADIDLARQWSQTHHFDAVVSTDGDSDRPLIADETGKWLRGDVACILCGKFLGADVVAAPISCNSAVEKCGWFKKVIRTKIGSPYVIEGMQQAQKEGWQTVVGYEANGGFLIQSNVQRNGRVLSPLPTRDAVILHIALLRLAKERRSTISALLKQLPERYTHSNRLKEFPTQKSREILAKFSRPDETANIQNLEKIFKSAIGSVTTINRTDGLRITFDSQDIVHLRPSGNAPEFRCYTESDCEQRALQLNEIALDIMEGWRTS